MFIEEFILIDPCVLVICNETMLEQNIKKVWSLVTVFSNLIGVVSVVV